MIPLDAMPVPLFGDRGFAWVDQQDIETVLSLRWMIHIGQVNKTQYAVTATKYGRQGTISLHRFIAIRAGLNLSKHIDHVDQNGLNNTRQNVRAATYSQNQANRALMRTNKTGFKGVSYVAGEGYRVQFTANGRRRRIGAFADPEAAGRVYDAWAKEAHGKFAWLNEMGLPR